MDLAQIASVSIDTIKRLERSPGLISANVATADAIVGVLDAAGIEFTNGGQPGVRFKEGLQGPRVEIDSVNGVRQIKFRTPGAPLKICTAADARREAEIVEQKGELALAKLLRRAAEKLRGPT
jgi:hypothetical protein